jgi:hypothetical protein
MAVPQVTSSLAIRSATTSTVLDISTIVDGSWMVVSVMSAFNETVTAPGSWSVLSTAQQSGSRSNYVFGKIKESADGSTVSFAKSGTGTAAFSLIWGSGAGGVTDWKIGNRWLRSDSAEPVGQRFNNIAPSVTTTLNDELVLAISHEATNAKVTPMEITNTPIAGWTQRLWLEQVAINDRIETIWIGSKEMASPAASGDVVLTYNSEQDSNGWAVQIAIASPVDTAPAPTPVVVGTPVNVISAAMPTTFTINRPTGVLSGDYIVVGIRNQVASKTADATSPGFTRLGAAFIPSHAQSRMHGIYGRPVTDVTVEPASYTFTMSSDGGRLVATAFIVRGVDLANPLAGYSNSYNGTIISDTGAQGNRSESYPLDAAPALTLFMGSSEFASPVDHTPTVLPSGYTEITHVVSSTNTAISRTYLWFGRHETLLSPVSAAEMRWSSTASGAVESISLRGTNATPPDPAGLGIAAADGAGNTTKVYYTTADGPRTPSAFIPMRRGFNTVTEMLAKNGATWAHRGGSLNYPEMSLYGYTQSVARGYGVLEVSLARTSDGVWFGLHDQTTDRTSGGSFGNASSQTWAQIQAQQNTIGSQGAPQPYMRWEQLIAAYGRTHIIVADPKYALGTYRTEFLDMVDRDLGPTRAVLKYSGSGSGAAAFSSAAQARGYQTWGFFYASDASAGLGGNGSLQTWGNSWTILGMEYTASQAIWNEALAFGKPVIAHIVPDQAGYNSSIAKGATGVQVSGVANVAPVSWWT